MGVGGGVPCAYLSSITTKSIQDEIDLDLARFFFKEEKKMR